MKKAKIEDVRMTNKEFEQAWALIEKLVYKTWHGLQGEHSCLDFTDFVNEARITAFKCLKKYDPDSPFKYQTYAMSSIRNRFYRMMKLDRSQKAISLDQGFMGVDGEEGEMRDSLCSDLAQSLFLQVQEEADLRSTLDSILSQLRNSDPLSAQLFQKRMEIYRRDPDLALCKVYKLIKKELRTPKSISSIRRKFSQSGSIGQTVYSALGRAA